MKKTPILLLAVILTGCVTRPHIFSNEPYSIECENSQTFIVSKYGRSKLDDNCKEDRTAQ